MVGQKQRLQNKDFGHLLENFLHNNGNHVSSSFSPLAVRTSEPEKQRHFYGIRFNTRDSLHLNNDWIYKRLNSHVSIHLHPVHLAAMCDAHRSMRLIFFLLLGAQTNNSLQGCQSKEIEIFSLFLDETCQAYRYLYQLLYYYIYVHRVWYWYA